ncbi:MAG: cytochrome P450 [Myxococcota bacterium]|jgi:cytochrome P450
MSTLSGPSNRWLTTWRLMSDPFRWYPEWRDIHGSTYLVKALNGDVVVAGDPEDVRRIFAARGDAIAPFGVEAAAPLIGRNSLLMLQGDRHRQERRLLTPPFHGERMRAYGLMIRDIATRAADGWAPGGTVRIADASLDVSLEVIIRAVFGVSADAEVDRYQQSVRSLMGAFSPALAFVRVLQRPMFGLGPWDRYVEARDQFDQMLFADIEARRASEERGADILSLLVDATYEDGALPSTEALRDQLITLLFAGHETTQIGIAWAMSWLNRHPDALERLLAELETVDPDDPAALARLPWLDAVVTETLRLNPIVPDIVRTLTKPMELTQGTLAAGTHVAPVAALVHTDPALYPEPLAFKPERWQGRRARPNEYLPFGGGVRRCIGEALALFEMKIVLATWLRAHRFELPTDAPPREPTHRRNLTMAPKTRIPLVYRGVRGGRVAA